MEARHTWYSLCFRLSTNISLGAAPDKRWQAQVPVRSPALLFPIKKKKSLFGDDLLSQGVTPQVPSALMSLTAGFEMLPGVSSSLQSPRDIFTNVSTEKNNYTTPRKVSSSPHHANQPSIISTT